MAHFSIVWFTGQLLFWLRPDFRPGEILEQACSSLKWFLAVWQNSYLISYSVLVKLTDFPWHSAQQKAHLEMICWKIKLQCRRSISTNDRRAGKSHHILQNKSSVFGMRMPPKVAQSFVGVLLCWYMQQVEFIGWFESSWYATWIEWCHCSVCCHFQFHAAWRDQDQMVVCRSVASDSVGFLFAVLFVRFDVNPLWV